MSHVTAMLREHPRTIRLDQGLLARAIDEALVCFQTCTACADACLSEDKVAGLVRCIRACLDCSTACSATVEVLSRHTAFDAAVARAQLQACITACTAAGDECAHHAAMHEHCKICADACRACERACRDLLASMG